MTKKIKRHNKKKTYNKIGLRIKESDQLFNDLNSKFIAEIDPDLPGNGQFYCIGCQQHFQNDSCREVHYKSKKHKRRLKLLQNPYRVIDSEIAAEMTHEKYQSKKMIMD
ncbi:zinc finger protein 593 homolog [Danaus plexippus]|uniref:zinc finger protein 593 homolog n=1 Tax=Danaus plexippus TaxID=13037 RepID=UPI002AB2C31B|nr:zinc finger protein 593 homolog [Danaus plexippus]